MKTRTRIVLLLFSIFFSLIIVFSIFIFYFTSQYSFNDFYKRLEIRAYSTARVELDNKDYSEVIKEFKVEYLEMLHDEKHYIHEYENIQKLESFAELNQLNLDFLKSIILDGVGSYRINSLFFSGIKYQTQGRVYLVITSANNFYYNHHMSYLRNLLVTCIIVTSIVLIFISYWFSKRLINPIKKITEKVNQIGTENLFIRLEGSEKEDELGALIKTFNNMLDRLETSFETQNNFISNASHELNTPLTSIIGEADVTLTRIRSVDEYIESLHNILEEAEKLNKKTKALLFLAQTGFNGKTLTFEEVRMDQLLFDVHETINRIHPDNKVSIVFSALPDNPEKLKVLGNEQLLHLAFSNVILNAYKYSNNQEVRVLLSVEETSIVIEVQDNGVGIPKDELQYIYDPFWRGSNTKSFEGYGIGLPLTRNIIKIHHGEIIVISEKNKGTIVLLKIPLKTDAQ